MRKYNIGDKVEVITDRYGIGHRCKIDNTYPPYIGEICTIKVLYGSDGIGLVREGTTYDWFFLESNVKPVTMHKHNIKVGMSYYVNDSTNIYTVNRIVGTTVYLIGSRTAIEIQYPMNILSEMLDSPDRVILNPDKNMSFKVGDKVKIKADSELNYGDNNNPTDIVGTVIEVRNFTNDFTTRVKWPLGINNYRDRDLELVNQGKIIGYKLLKDTPTGNKGLVLTKVGDAWQGNGKYTTVYVPPIAVLDTEWFEPIYEEVKPTSVVVKTAAGDVIVTAKELTIKGELPLTVHEAQSIFTYMNKVTTKSGYVIKVETFKVGCKTFHVNDIPKLEAAIKQVS